MDKYSAFLEKEIEATNKLFKAKELLKDFYEIEITFHKQHFKLPTVKIKSKK